MITVYEKVDNEWIFFARNGHNTLKETKIKYAGKKCIEGQGYNGSKLVDGVIIPLEKTIDQRRKNRIAEIDKTSRETIKKGFSYDGEKFSLSAAAQSNWNSLIGLHNAGLAPFPIECSTIDDGVYNITSLDFFAAAFTAFGGRLKTGRALKLKVKTSDDPESVVEEEIVEEVIVEEEIVIDPEIIIEEEEIE